MDLTLEGVRFDVVDEGSGPAIVLLHAFPLAKETWDAQARVLMGRARVVRFDLRGLGKSSVPPGPYLMETLAGDVAAVLDALSIERAAIAGHSLGGYVAFAFYRMFAERCSGLGIVCSRATADDPAAAAGRLELADEAEAHGIEPVVAAFVPRCFAPHIYADRPDLVEAVRTIAAATDPRGAAGALRGMAARVASTDLLPDIEVPLALVAGRHDAFVPVHELQRIADAVPAANLDVLDCGHLPQWEVPNELSAALERLLSASIRVG